MLTKDIYNCPNCGAVKRFARYLREDGTEYADHVGRCERRNSCGYDYTPKAYLEELKRTGRSLPPLSKEPPKPPKLPTYLNATANGEILRQIERRQGVGTFYNWLASLVGHERARLSLYHYRTTCSTDDKALFWYVDTVGRIIDGKLIRYNTDGHRDKKTPPSWLYTAVFKRTDPETCYYIPQDAERPKTPLFGAHLLSVPRYASRAVCIVESEKTAILGSCLECLKPEGLRRLWLATGGGSNINGVLNEPLLKGRKLIFFPDNDHLADKWQQCATYAKNTLHYDVTVYPVTAFTPPEWLRPGYDVGDFLADVAGHRPRAAKVSDLNFFASQNGDINKLIEAFNLEEIK